MGPSALIEHRDLSTLVSGGGGEGEVLCPRKGCDGPGREILAGAENDRGKSSKCCSAPGCARKPSQAS